MSNIDIKDCHQVLQDFWPKLKEWYSTRYPDRSLFLTCCYRTPEEQKQLYDKNRKGMILTRCDGFIKKSKHNLVPSQAFDVAVKHHDLVTWRDEFYSDLGDSLLELDLSNMIEWGGDWETFKDYPHFELK